MSTLSSIPLRQLAQLCAFVAALCAYPQDLHAEPASFIDHIEIIGAERTSRSTLLALLPHAPPAYYTASDVSELARRISNLEIFDEALVEQRGSTLYVELREKWTLIPQLDLAGGESLADLYVFLGFTEFNLFGSGNALELSVYRERRGFGFHTSFQEHVYRRDRWSFGAEASYATSELRFDNGEGWYNATALLYLWTTSTPIVFDYLRYETGVFYRHEQIEDATGDSRPPNGHMFGGSMMFTWDSYQWSDLTPSGWSVSLVASPGFFVGPTVPQSRHRLDLKLKLALPLTSLTALVARLEAGTTTRGNANHSLLIGSVEGVRGLSDYYYFTWLQAFLNVELRQSVRLAARWALQGVVFVDGGAFERVTERGLRGEAHLAFSVGVGARIIPTWLSGLVLRFDVARLVTPDPSFFFQYGLSQYF